MSDPTRHTAPLTPDEVLQAHLSECVECWEAMAAYEEEFGMDYGLPEHPEMTSEEARRAHG